MSSKRSINQPRVRMWRAAKKIVDCLDDRKYAGLCENFVSYLRAFYKHLGYYKKWLVAQKDTKLAGFSKDNVLRILRFILAAHKDYDFYVDETIRSLGKFVNEPSYTLYYYTLGMDDDGKPVYLESEEETLADDAELTLIGHDYDVSDEERFLFPALEDSERVRIIYRDDGLVENETLGRCQR